MWVARIVEHGFVAPGPARPQRPDEPYRLRFLDGLDAAVPYFLVGLEAEANGREVVVIAAQQLAVSALVAPLSAHFADRLVAFVRADRTGWASVSCADHASQELVAAAVATVKAVGGWDESSPIVIEIGARELAVVLEFQDLQWLVRVMPRP